MKRNLLISGIICLLIGIILILYAEHVLHQHHVVATTKTFFQKMKDFFAHLGNSINGTPEKASNYTLGYKFTLGFGIALSVLGILMILFIRKKPK